MERGPAGGIVLADDYRRALAQFSNDELQALFMAAAGPMTDLGLISPSRALQKLAGALPPPQRRAAEANRDRLLLDHNRWARGEQPTAVLRRLRRAIAEQLAVRLEYRDRAGALTSRRLEPLGLVAKAGIWYLVAHEAEKGLRTFRAQRIVSVEETGDGFERPADFDLEAHWNASVASIEARPSGAYDTVVRVRIDTLAPLTAYWDFTLLAEEPDFATLRVAFPNRDVAVAQLLALGDGVQILEPAELPEAIVAYAREVLARYAPALGNG
jgi:predicted DNA-binding transcriptional regulator YafY